MYADTQNTDEKTTLSYFNTVFWHCLTLLKKITKRKTLSHDGHNLIETIKYLQTYY
jgi:hypothetical protein